MSEGTQARALVWTRGREDGEADRALLGEASLPADVRVLHWPCLRTVAVPVAAAELEAKLARLAKPLVAVVTSAKGAAFALADAALASRLWQAPLQAHTHGEATARALRAAGVDVVWHGHCRTAAELGAHLLQSLAPSTRVLVISAREPAYDLVEALRKGGRQADALVCYETAAQLLREDGSDPDAAWLAARARETRGVVCFASPSAVRAFVTAFSAHRERVARQLEAVCLGPTTAAAAHGDFPRVHVASRNVLSALVEAACERLRARA